MKCSILEAMGMSSVAQPDEMQLAAMSTTNARGLHMSVPNTLPNVVHDLV